MITKDFIREWEPKYDEIESDEPKYQRLVEAVEAEAERDQTLTHETFIRILDWKAARVKGKIDKEHPERYADAFRRVLDPEMSPDERMEMLWSLPGIGPPVASTILHFMFPNDMPIYDRRTVEALNRFGCIKQSKTSESGYSEFRAALLRIRDDRGEFTLRQIDRTLFAYHKVEMEKSGGNPPPGSKNVTTRTQPTPKRRNVPRDTGLLTNVEKVLRLFGERTEVELGRDEIIDRVLAAFPGTKRGSIMPTDYCYNSVNKDSSSCRHPVFELVEHGKYRCLGENYLYTGDVYWKEEKVGRWENGTCTLWKDPRKR